jgi:uncharacterized protein YhbP (UPF0306 family)
MKALGIRVIKCQHRRSILTTIWYIHAYSRISVWVNNAFACFQFLQPKWLIFTHNKTRQERGCQQTPEESARFVISHHPIGQVHGWVQTKNKTSCTEVFLTITQSKIIAKIRRVFFTAQFFEMQCM